MSAVITFDDIVLGERFRTSSRTIFDADIVNFAGLSGDFNRLHVDEEFAATTMHGRRIAHGMLIASIVTGLRSRLDDYVMLGFLETQRRFAAPVFPGDTISAEYEVVDMRRSKSRPDTGIVTLSVNVVNQRGESVQQGRDILLLEGRTGDQNG